MLAEACWLRRVGRHAADLGALLPSGAGAIAFETHVYTPLSYSSISELEAQAVPLLALLRRFSAGLGGLNATTLIGEWALSHVSGSLGVEEAARWWYRAAAASSNGIGLAAWNYDGPGGWGAVVPNGGAPLRAWWSSVNRWP